MYILLQGRSYLWVKDVFNEIYIYINTEALLTILTRGRSCLLVYSMR